MAFAAEDSAPKSRTTSRAKGETNSEKRSGRDSASDLGRISAKMTSRTVIIRVA